ncbi:MAG: glycosyltransferase family 4 protein [Verrucomicrobiota bacterium]
MAKLPWAGSEELWFLAAEHLRKRGSRVTVSFPAMRGRAEQLNRLSDHDIEVRPFGARKALVRRLAKSFFVFLGGRIGTGEIPFPRPRVADLGEFVLVSQGAILDGLMWLEFLEEQKIPYAILCQANLEAQWPDDAIAARVRSAFGKARKVFFVSEENERLFRIQTGYELQNTSQVWNPLQPGTPADPLPWPQVNGDSLKLAMVGRVEPFAKGQDLVLEVLSMPKWKERSVKLTIYGNGPWADTLKLIVGNRGLTMIEDGGYASPAEIWKTHHALLLPSRHEGKSLAMLEALWLGRPVVATRLAGAPEEVVDGENGFLCEAPSVALLDEVLERAWKCRNDLPAMGERAAKRIRERMPEEPGVVLADEIAKLASEAA